MKSLVRLEASGYTLSEAVELSELENMTAEERLGLVLPIEDVFKKYRKLVLPDFFARLARCGLEIYLNKIHEELPIGERVTLYDNNGFFALGEVREFDDGAAIKPIKQFEL